MFMGIKRIYSSHVRENSRSGGSKQTLRRPSMKSHNPPNGGRVTITHYAIMTRQVTRSTTYIHITYTHSDSIMIGARTRNRMATLIRLMMADGKDGDRVDSARLRR